MRVLMSVTSWAATLVEKFLQEEGFLVTGVKDGTAIFESLSLMCRPIVLLETNLPDADWAASIVKLRQQNRNMSILVLNNRKSVADQTKALELGADDVIAPDMDGREIAARIRAIALRRAGHAGVRVNYGPMQMNVKERRVYWGHQTVEMTPTQYNIFETICLAAPYAVSKDVIMAELYGVEEGSEPVAIHVFLSNIRSRLEDAGASRDIIETQRGRGYRLAKSVMSQAPLHRPNDMLVENLDADFGFAEQIAKRA